MRRWPSLLLGLLVGVAYLGCDSSPGGQLPAPPLFPPERHVHFPHDYSLGDLAVQDWEGGSATRKPWGDARGTVRIPAGKELILNTASATSADFSALSSLGPSDIQRLVLTGRHANDEALSHVSVLTGLRELELHDAMLLRHYFYPHITDKGFSYLHDLTELQTLRLRGVSTLMSREGPEILRTHPSLEEVYFHIIIPDWHGSGLYPVTDAYIKRIVQLPSLKTLGRLYIKADTDLSPLKKLKALEELSLQATNISDQGIADLSELTNLRVLDIRSAHVSRKGLIRLQRALPGCRILHSVPSPTPTSAPRLRPIS